MYVRFTPKADTRDLPRYVRFVLPKADTCSATSPRRVPPRRRALRSRNRMLFGRGAGNPLLGGSRGFRAVRGCRNHMNDLVAAAF
jgi:hypothetical protein